MEVKIENMVFGWHEELPKMFLELLNTLVLTKNEQDVRGVMEVFARKELLNASMEHMHCLFQYAFL